MAGLNFTRGVARALEAGKLFHSHSFDRSAMAGRGLKYEKLHQLTNELLWGVC
jgi:hypothetical protein